jgi:hypothetical protein
VITTKVCKLSLFTWACVELEGRKEVLPICPTHVSSKTRVGTFGTGMIVTCHEDPNHLIRLCEREQFEAELKEARIRLRAETKAANARWFRYQTSGAGRD